ncbi:MAG: hypothetical protein L0221_01895, partial [Chloroflexi bacterium]|nr:hypothetical protein [Chloroflexota bacterium]
MRGSFRRAVVSAAGLCLITPLAGHAATSGESAALALARRTAERVGSRLVPDRTPPLSSDNVELVTTVPGSAAGMRIVGTYAYVTGWAGLTVLDVSSPAAPKVVSTLPIAHFENEDVESDGKIVLISNDREKGNTGGVLYVVDVADPAAPAL